VVFLAFAGVRKTAHTVVGFDAQFLLKGVDEGAKHVQKHAFTARPDYFQHFHIHQSGEHNGFDVLDFGRVIDLPYNLVCLVGIVNKGQPDVPGFHLKLGQDGISKGLCRDAGAVRDEKYGAMGHGR
jgi:hypothetical protein